MGTAGHIDHGKTALIHALTGFDCDTHPEEKRRGITINLGFTHLDLPTGKLGIVDVPGHRDFIHTMVGGACGIDFVILVVAATSGIMPQTREHLCIMDILGIKSGLIALTKIDCVENSLLDICREEIRELVSDTFLKDAPIIPVSSVTKEGIDELKSAITNLIRDIKERPKGGAFRMFIDRIFTVKGFGTVVTGSVISGSLNVDQEVYLLPGINKSLRVRRLERHGKKVEKVEAGDRASINLTGLNRDDFFRGMILSDRMLGSTSLIDAELRLFKQSPTFKLWQRVIFHAGTYESQARVHLIDKDRLNGGDNAFVQIHLERPSVLSHEDRFIIRNTSSDATLGGGRIIDTSPLHHRRRTEKLIKSISTLVKGDIDELISLEVHKRMRAVTSKEIADILNISHSKVMALVKRGLKPDIKVYCNNDSYILIGKKEDSRIRSNILKHIADFHKNNPMEARGLTIEELSGGLAIPQNRDGKKYLELVLIDLVKGNRLKKLGRTWAVSNHEVSIDTKNLKNIQFVESFLKNCGMKTPLLGELISRALKEGIAESNLKKILHFLVKNKSIYHIEDNYIHSSIVDSSRNKLLNRLIRKNGITVAEFRDLVGGNRKICLLLLAFYDSEGLTERNGNVRLITAKGKVFIEEGKKSV